ncbi:hypothetical protein [Thiomonas sp.]
MQNENSRDVLASIQEGVDQIDSAHIVMKCPAHRGALTSSLEVTLAAGRLEMYCMCGCPPDRILAAARGTGQEQPDHYDDFVNALAAA